MFFNINYLGIWNIFRIFASRNKIINLKNKTYKYDTVRKEFLDEEFEEFNMLFHENIEKIKVRWWLETCLEV